ncbi:essential MCU regulator, mitochondrial [Solea senegalensis]|uniref:Essential MCU regulator, mitochondrial n=2 Tax=Solea senegalensis TaxID=28829 RepID=A0AAV6RI40_SOLSE|nr:essential MCU regulator, mitochondrial-like isoform X1 [Solea senegalensis]KAG7505043.1 essential MCU regulator, mitochondrial [Solea senegalensis]
MCRYRRGVALLLTHTQRLSPVLRIAAAPNSVNMASALGRLARLSVLRRGRASPLTRSDGQGMAVTSRRTAVCTSSGAILPKPRKTPFGLFRIAVVVVPFLYVGTQISKNFAALLEEHDIFVPEDDDDDD